MRRQAKITSPPPSWHVADLLPRSVIDDELDWLFNRAECDMGITSNFQASLGIHGDGGSRVTPEDAAEAAHRYRWIRRWLSAIPDSDAGVIQCAYELRPWPVALYDELGRLTGVVVRLACALDVWPASRAGQQVIEMARAEWLASSGGELRSDPTFAALRRDGEVRFARAHHAYCVARGRLRPRRLS